MFERKHERLIPARMFYQRLARSFVFVAAILCAALGLGVLGYHFVAGLEWIDALLDASMILTGMGPVSELKSTGAKLFASAYALFSGLIFITVMGVALAPAMHRMIHKFHLADDDDEKK